MHDARAGANAYGRGNAWRVQGIILILNLRTRVLSMNKYHLVALGIVAACGTAATNAADTHDHSIMVAAPSGLPADVALTGVPMKMSPYDLPHQFRTQLRGDVANSSGTLTMKQVGKDVQYTVAWN